MVPSFPYEITDQQKNWVPLTGTKWQIAFHRPAVLIDSDMSPKGSLFRALNVDITKHFNLQILFL